MKKRVYVLYDDRIRPDEKVSEITGDKSYGNVIYKQKSLRQRMEEAVREKDYVIDFFAFETDEQREEYIRRISSADFSSSVLYIYSCYGIKDPEKFGFLLDKAQFLNQPERIVLNRKTAALMFPGTSQFLRWAALGYNSNGSEDMEELSGDMLLDLTSFEEFTSYITGGFDARFFNNLDGNQYTVVKTSSNKEKIKKEYEFYYYLPRQMQHWFVQPFDYRETEDKAGYTMERIHATDLAIQYVHGAIDSEKFEQILEQLFYFIKTRSTRRISQDEYREQSDLLYLDKVQQRLEEFHQSPYYDKMNAMAASGTAYSGIDDIFSHYYDLYRQIQSKYRFEPLSCVSHGDLCFNNILYESHAGLMRFIDPKGALSENEIWMNPWYDLAKLSHSVCGMYDFFNSGLYSIEVEKDMELRVRVDFDNSEYVALFKKYLEDNQFSYTIVRLYEASLFLSMLPLHLDNPQKVFGFLLNAADILREVEECLKE